MFESVLCIFPCLLLSEFNAQISTDLLRHVGSGNRGSKIKIGQYPAFCWIDTLIQFVEVEL